MTLEETISLFKPLDVRNRLELLLTYSEELPPLPPGLAAERDSGTARVHECQTPVWLWVTVSNGTVQIIGDAAEEAPTVRGFVSLLMDMLNGKTVEEVLATPVDLVSRLGIDQALGMLRMRGLTSMVMRIKREVHLQSGEIQATM